MARDEAEYYALIKGLEKTIEMDYSNVIVNTRYEPITGKLRDGYTPPDELKKFHESVVQLIEQFNKVDVNPKPWKR